MPDAGTSFHLLTVGTAGLASRWTIEHRRPRLTELLGSGERDEQQAVPWESEASQAMLDVYPTGLRKWIAQRGGLSSNIIFLYGRELAEIVPPCASSVIANLSGGAKTPHQPHVIIKADTTRAALMARQAR
jgi:hypothetical protein